MDKEKLIENSRLLAKMLGMKPRELLERGIIEPADYEELSGWDSEKVRKYAELVKKSRHI